MKQEYHHNNQNTFAALQEIRKLSLDMEAEADRLRGQVYKTLTVKRVSLGIILRKLGILLLQSFTLPIAPAIVVVKLLNALTTKFGAGTTLPAAKKE